MHFCLSLPPMQDRSGFYRGERFSPAAIKLTFAASGSTTGAARLAAVYVHRPDRPCRNLHNYAICVSLMP